MSRTTKWVTALGILVLATALFFGSALAYPGDGPRNGDGEGPRVGQMDPERFALMIQRMTERHGPEFAAEMVQRRSEAGECTGEGYGLMGAGQHEEGRMGRGFGRMGNGPMQGAGWMQDVEPETATE